MSLTLRHTLLGLLAVGVAAPASAADDFFEVWLHPVVSVGLDKNTAIEVESWQRFRQGGDTHGYRGWIKQQVAPKFEAGLGIERRSEGAVRETRYLQQLSWPLGPLKMRTRLEQRDLNSYTRLGIRFRQRAGVSVPLSSNKKGWAAMASAEAFLTLRAGTVTGQDGLTGLRTIVGVERSFKNGIGLELGYVRQQNIRRGAPDRVGQGPLIGLKVKL